MNKYLQTILGAYLTIKVIQFVIGITVVIVIILAVGQLAHREDQNMTRIANASISAKGSDFQNGDHLPLEYTCEGLGTPPALQISQLPANAHYVEVEFSDFSAGSAVIPYWQVWNMPVENNMVDMTNPGVSTVVGTNHFSKIGYTPPCHNAPDDKTPHTYKFRVRAFTRALPFSKPEDSQKLWVYYTSSFVVAETDLTVIY